MDNLSNTILTKVTDLAQIPSVITKVADKLLNGLVPHEDTSARTICVFYGCSKCFGGGTTRVQYCYYDCCNSRSCSRLRVRRYC